MKLPTIILAFLQILIVSSCSIFYKENQECLTLCNQIIMTPDTLEFIGRNKEISSFSEYETTKLNYYVQHLKKYFSKGYSERNSFRKNGFLIFEFYGDSYVDKITQKNERAFIRFSFDNEFGNWKLFNILDWNPETNELYPRDHGD